MCRVKSSFKPHQNEHNSFKDTGARKRQNNHVTLTWKFPWKPRSTTLLPLLSSHPKILKAFLKTFAPKMKPTKCPAREKQHEARKAKKRGGEKAKSKSQGCRFTFKLKNYLKILLSAHAMRRPWIVRPVNSFVVSCISSLHNKPENHSTSFKTRFLVKSPGANGLIHLKMASSISRQDEMIPAFLLATQGGKMDLGWPSSSSQENVNLCFWPYNKSCINHACLFKMAGYWPHLWSTIAHMYW